MSTPFTIDPTVDDFDMHNIAVANEIYDAIYERSVAYGMGGYLRPGRPAVGDIFTSLFLRACQDWIYWMGTFEAFLDHTQAVGGSFNGESSLKLPRFTFATLTAAAGLPGNNFRRLEQWDGVAAPSFSSGMLEDGDIIGYWIFEDIIKCLSIMKWTDLNYSPQFVTLGELGQRHARGTGRTLAEAIAANAASWSGAGWVTYGYWEPGAYLASVESLTGEDDSGIYYYVFSSRAGYGSTLMVNVPTVNPCSISLYTRISQSVTLGHTFQDIDSLAAAVNTWYKYDELPEDRVPNRTGVGFGRLATNPAALVPIAAGSGSVAAASAGIVAVMKWNFSRCNP